MINNKYNINQRKTIYHLTTLISNYLFNVNDSSFSKIYRLILRCDSLDSVLVKLPVQEIGYRYPL